jgi:hypothetical protein
MLHLSTITPVLGYQMYRYHVLIRFQCVRACSDSRGETDNLVAGIVRVSSHFENFTLFFGPRFGNGSVSVRPLGRSIDEICLRRQR